MTKLKISVDQYNLIKDLIRMIMKGNGDIALLHIYANFVGMPVVDFIFILLTIAEKEFIIGEEFYSSLRQIKDTDALEWYIFYWTDLFSGKTGWS